MSDNRLEAKNIKSNLESLIIQIQPIEPELAKKLSQIKSSIKNYVPADFMSRRTLADFLNEIHQDSKLYFYLCVSTDDERKLILENLSASEKYWYLVAFPSWFSKYDQNFSTWFGKMKSKKFMQDDKVLIYQLSTEIEDQGGDSYWGFILDLSMATDLVISSKLTIPLCVQLTTVSQNLSVKKKEHWETLLYYWGVKRGLFLSFNPKGEYGDVKNLATLILQKGDALPSHCYDDCYV